MITRDLLDTAVNLLCNATAPFAIAIYMNKLDNRGLVLRFLAVIRSNLIRGAISEIITVAVRLLIFEFIFQNIISIYFSCSYVEVK